MIRGGRRGVTKGRDGQWQSVASASSRTRHCGPSDGFCQHGEILRSCSETAHGIELAGSGLLIIE
jgi:hypothetical protein